jgi:DNA-binding protein H-NS
MVLADDANYTFWPTISHDNSSYKCRLRKTHSRIVEHKDSKMAQIDLSGYNLGELKGLRHEIEQEINARERQDVKKAREQILAIAQEAGISVADLLAKTKRKVKNNNGQKVNPKYQNPADGSQTWTGRGRQPRWIAEGVASGKALDDFRI